MFKSLIASIFTTASICSTDESKSMNLQSLPIEDEWQVFWGGSTRKQNHHFDISSQKRAIDLVISTDQEGFETYKNAGKINEDYYCWKKSLLSVFDGKVMLVVDGIPDNIPGQLNEQMVYGNTIMIQSDSGVVAVYAHLALNSTKVKVGDKVKRGDLIGLCGNSGNSSEPHLHFHLQSKVGFEKGSGVIIMFSSLTVNGEVKKDYSPIKNDKIKK